MTAAYRRRPTVLADRGLMPDMGPSVYAIAGWVMQRGEEFVTADLRRDERGNYLRQIEAH